MSGGLGWVQRACIAVLREHEMAVKKGAARGWLTTFDIAAEVYQLKPTRWKDGCRWVTDAQHVAVKRALESLQRQGHIIGFRDGGLARLPGVDYRGELAHIWMTEIGLWRWLKEATDQLRAAATPEASIAAYAGGLAIFRRAEAVGMAARWPMYENYGGATAARCSSRLPLRTEGGNEKCK